jgi:hypothetical protein
MMLAPVTTNAAIGAIRLENHELSVMEPTIELTKTRERVVFGKPSRQAGPTVFTRPRTALRGHQIPQGRSVAEPERPSVWFPLTFAWPGRTRRWAKALAS